jgi:hypothetical protein
MPAKKILKRVKKTASPSRSPARRKARDSSPELPADDETLPELPALDVENSDDASSQASLRSHVSQHSQPSQRSQPSQPSGSQPPSAQPTKKQKLQKTQLNREDEEKVAGWFLEHEIFWNKSHPQYKDKILKERMLAELAEVLDPGMTGAQLGRWLSSMRTQYGKLIKGDQQNLTEKQKWILKNFEVCRAYINRMPSRSGVKVSYFFCPYFF